ncbi:Bro-N domain-containing protein [Pseudomonas cichorii]|nr:Bro-N domain-containing protein [Pseudomonas cichorii]
MYTLNPSAPCTEQFEAILFNRHHRMLRTVMCNTQAWFCLADLARLMGKQLDERATLKLDPDQRRTAWLQAHGRWEKCVLVSESGVFAMLIHHYIPENRALRQWLTHDVLPVLHQRHTQTNDQPSLNQMQWLGTSLNLLHWRNESWIRLQDMPHVVLEVPPQPKRGMWRKVVETFAGKRIAA